MARSEKYHKKYNLKIALLLLATFENADIGRAVVFMFSTRTHTLTMFSTRTHSPHWIVLR